MDEVLRNRTTGIATIGEPLPYIIWCMYMFVYSMCIYTVPRYTLCIIGCIYMHIHSLCIYTVLRYTLCIIWCIYVYIYRLCIYTVLRYTLCIIWCIYMFIYSMCIYTVYNRIACDIHIHGGVYYDNILRNIGCSIHCICRHNNIIHNMTWFIIMIY